MSEIAGFHRPGLAKILARQVLQAPVIYLPLLLFVGMMGGLGEAVSAFNLPKYCERSGSVHCLDARKTGMVSFSLLPKEIVSRISSK